MNILLTSLICLLIVFIFLGAITMYAALYRTFQAIRNERPKACNWTDRESECSTYETSCGESFHNANDGSPVTDWASHCPYCGGKIKAR